MAIKNKVKEHELLMKMYEVGVQLFCIPTTMIAGFARLIVMPRIKTHFSYATLGQELLLHQLPLMLLFFYNNNQLGKTYFTDEYTLDNVLLIVAILNVLQIITEISYFRYWLSKGINLEQRVRNSTQNRMQYTCILGWCAALFVAIFFIVGVYGTYSDEGYTV